MKQKRKWYCTCGHAQDLHYGKTEREWGRYERFRCHHRGCDCTVARRAWFLTMRKRLIG